MFQQKTPKIILFFFFFGCFKKNPWKKQWNKISKLSYYYYYEKLSIFYILYFILNMVYQFP